MFFYGRQISQAAYAYRMSNAYASAKSRRRPLDTSSGYITSLAESEGEDEVAGQWGNARFRSTRDLIEKGLDEIRIILPLLYGRVIFSVRSGS